MVQELGLKGNALLIYALIYGFCQDGYGCFTGSLDYIMAWTNSSRTGVIKAIAQLVEMGLIEKEKRNGVGCIYTVCEREEVDEEQKEDDFKKIREAQEAGKQSLRPVNKVNSTGKQSLQPPVNKVNTTGKQSLQNNINNIINNIYIIFNRTCGTNFNPTNYINKRLKELLKEYSEDEILMTVKYKYEDWGKNPFKFRDGSLSSKLLRPDVIFGKNFEKYYDEAQRPNQINCSQSVEFNPEELCDEVF